MRPTGLGPSAAAVAVDYRTGRVFAVSIGNSSLSVLDSKSGKLLHTLDAGVASPDIAVEEMTGHVFMPSAISDTVDMRDGTTGQLLRTISLPQRPVVAIPTGRHQRVFIVVGTPTPNGGAIRPHAAIAVLDGRTGHVVRLVPLIVPGGGLSAVAIDVQRGHVLLAMGTTVDVVDAVSGAVLHISQAPRRISALTIDRRSDHIFAIGTGSAMHNRIVRQAVLFTLDGMTGTVTRTRRLGNVILVSADADIDEQTRRLFIASALEPLGATGLAGGIVVRDVDTGAAIRTAVPGPSASELALSRRTGRVFVINLFAPTQMLDARTGAVLRTIALPDLAQAVAVDEQTRRAFIATINAVYTLDARTGATVQTVQLP